MGPRFGGFPIAIYHPFNDIRRHAGRISRFSMRSSNQGGPCHLLRRPISTLEIERWSRHGFVFSRLENPKIIHSFAQRARIGGRPRSKIWLRFEERPRLSAPTPRAPHPEPHTQNSHAPSPRPHPAPRAPRASHSPKIGFVVKIFLPPANKRPISPHLPRHANKLRIQGLLTRRSNHG
jgi:hypothetical protein